MTKVEAWFLLIAGFIMGTVFTFGMQYWHAPVTKEESMRTTAIYESCDPIEGRSGINQIIVRVKNHEQLYIDGVCANSKLLNNIDNLVCI